MRAVYQHTLWLNAAVLSNGASVPSIPAAAVQTRGPLAPLVTCLRGAWMLAATPGRGDSPGDGGGTEGTGGGGGSAVPRELFDRRGEARALLSAALL